MGIGADPNPAELNSSPSKPSLPSFITAVPEQRLTPGSQAVSERAWIGAVGNSLCSVRQDNFGEEALGPRQESRPDYGLGERQKYFQIKILSTS